MCFELKISQCSYTNKQIKVYVSNLPAAIIPGLIFALLIPIPSWILLKWCNSILTTPPSIGRIPISSDDFE